MTTTSRAGIGAAVLTLSGLAVMGLGGTASAATAAKAGPPADNPACAKGQHYAPKRSGCVNNGMSVGRRNIQPGQTETVVIRGFKVGTTVRVTFDGRTVGTDVMDGASYAKLTFKVPANARAGRHSIVAYGTAWNGQATSLALEIKVVGRSSAPGATAPSASGTAATTELHATNAAAQTSTGGGSTELIALGAAGVLLMGAGPTTLRIMRRRSES